MGLAPLVPWPLRRIYQKRTRKLRDVFKSAAEELGATYINMFYSRRDDPFTRDPARYFAPDYLHPSAEGYALWHAMISRSMRQSMPHIVKRFGRQSSH